MNRIGDYKLIEKIGAGGMGEVWRAENVHTRKAYAVKLLPADATQDRNFVARFFDEGRVMSDLDHPYIVRVHHVGADKETGRYYLVEDLIERVSGVSISLHDLLEEAEGHRLPESDVRKWADQVAEALAYAHEHGVIHRDIKPANVLIDNEGNAKVTDFGLAKAIGEEYVQSQIHVSMEQSMGAQRTQSPSGQSDLSMGDEATMDTGGSGSSAGRTTADALLGTYDYMSPEQRGELAGVNVSPASDIYAFGVMVYRLLTGRRPAGMAKPVSKVVKGLPKSWDKVCAKCLEHRPEDRYADGGELLKGLGSSRSGSGFNIPVKPLAVMAAAAVLLWLGYEQADRPIRLAVGVEQAVPKKIDAEEALGKARRLDGLWSGYAEMIDALGVQQKKAQAFFDKDEHGTAVEQYQGVITGCADLEKQEVQRLVAAEARSSREVAGKNAEAAGAARDAVKMWDAGQVASKSGANAYTSGDFKKAEVSWRLAVKQYKAATEYAEGYQKADLVRKSYEDALLGADNVLLSEYGGAKWSEVKQSAKRAKLQVASAKWDEAATEYRKAGSGLSGAMEEARELKRQASINKHFAAARAAQGKCEWQKVYDESRLLLKLDSSNKEGLALKNEAEIYLVSTWKLIAMVNGKVVPAAITIDKKIYQSPLTLVLEEGASYLAQLFYASGGKTYDCDDVSVIVDWKGTREQVVALEEIKGPKQGEDMSVNLGGGVEMEFVWCPPGEFMMGSNDESSNEKPLHKVTLTKGFWMGKYEVTRRQYKQIIGSIPSSFNQPVLDAAVEQVSWGDCQDFTKKLNQRMGRGHRDARLPTEAEWEYACRAGTKTKYNTGDNTSALGKAGWYKDNSASHLGKWSRLIKHDGGREVHEVGKKTPNAWGLHDMHGNVSEWCEDWYGAYPRGNTSDPTGATSGRYRVLRGGGWVSIAKHCSSASRGYNDSELRGGSLGFRVLLAVP